MLTFPLPTVAPYKTRHTSSFSTREVCSPTWLIRPSGRPSPPRPSASNGFFTTSIRSTSGASSARSTVSPMALSTTSPSTTASALSTAAGWTRSWQWPNARIWQADAKTAYANAFPPANNALARSFLDNIMGGAGKLIVSGMKFIVSGGGPSLSKYGVWGDPSLPPPKQRHR